MGNNDTALNIVVRLKDEASQKFGELKTKLEGVQKSMEPAISASNKFALGLAGAGVAAVGFGTMAVKAAMGAQVEMAAFETTMKTIPGVTKEATNAILERANAAIKLGFDDEEAANVMAKLYQRTGDVNQAMKLNQLAMDLARAKGVSLAQAGDMIGMVMSGAGKALKQYGIEIDETLGPMAALEQLQGKVGPQAEAFSSTLQGQMEALKQMGSSVMEAVGEKIIPILAKLLGALVPVIEKVNEWVGDIQNLTTWLREHETVLIIVAGAIAGMLVPAMISFGITLITSVIPALIATAVAMAPFLIGGAIVGGLVAGIVWIVKNWDMLSAKMKATWEGIKAGFREGVNYVIGLAESWANSWVNAANTIIRALNKIQFSIPDWVPGIGGKSFGVNIPLAQEVKLNRMEHGGIVSGARGTAVPIIAHGGEQIIPAGNVRNGGGGINVSLVLNYPTFKNEDEIEIVRKQVEDAFRDVVRVYKLQPV